MKKTHFALIIGTMFSLLTNTGSAQILSANSLSKIDAGTFVFNAEGNTAGYKSTAAFNKAGFKATKNFNRQFKDQLDVKWIADEKTISASFLDKGVRTCAVYDNKGYWIRNMKVYMGDNMPKDVISLVKGSGYRKYTITQVQEFNKPEYDFYVVHVENDREYKKLCVYDSQINVIEEFDKQR